MRFRTLNTLTLAVAMLGGAPALAASQAAEPPADQPADPTQPNAEQSDRALLYRLIRQVRRIDRDTQKLTEQAMNEARAANGEINAETKAQLLSLRDDRDRAFARMHVLSIRYGWEIPEFDKPTVEVSSRQEAETSVFGAVDSMIKARFTAEAMRIAGMVQLPVVSLESMG